LALLAGLAALVRFFWLDHWGFWFDEAHSIALAANSDLGSVVGKGIADQQAPLFFILLHLWLRLGDSDYFLRSLPALLGVFTVLAVYWLGSEVGGRGVGRLAGVLAALSSYLVYYSQYLRGYILVALAVGVGAAALFRAVRSGGWGWWVVYALAAIVGLYTHQFGLFALAGLGTAGLGLILGEKSARWPRLYGWAAAHTLIWLAYLPWVGVVWEQFRRVQAGLDVWVEPVGLGSWKTLYDWLWYRTRAEYGLLPDTALRLLRYVTTLLLGWTLLRALVRRQWTVLSLVGLLLIPPALVFGVSLVGRPVWDPRFMVFAAVPFAVFLAVAVDGLGRRNLRLAWGVGLVFGMVLPLWSYYVDPIFANPDIRGASAWLAAHRQPQEPVLHPNEQSFLPALWYNRRLVANPGPGFRVFCPWPTPPPEWCEASPTADYWVGGLEPERLLPVDAFLGGTGASQALVEILYNRHRVGEREEFAARLRAALPPAYEARLAAAFLGVDLYEVRPRGP